MITLITETIRFILAQPDLSVKLKGQTNRDRLMHKRTGTGTQRDTIPSPTSYGTCDTQTHNNVTHK